MQTVRARADFGRGGSLKLEQVGGERGKFVLGGKSLVDEE
jgi:hypothetical protein